MGYFEAISLWPRVCIAIYVSIVKAPDLTLNLICYSYDEALAAFSKTLHKLKVDYLDLYLIHWPGKSGMPLNYISKIIYPTPSVKGEKVHSTANKQARINSWKALNKLYSEGQYLLLSALLVLMCCTAGKCRAIGVSNFLENHLKGLVNDGAEVPHVNQVGCLPLVFKFFCLSEASYADRVPSISATKWFAGLLPQKRYIFSSIFLSRNWLIKGT